MLNQECGWKDGDRSAVVLQTITEMRMDERQQGNVAENTEMSTCHFLYADSRISATRPGCPTARCARPGQALAVIRTNLLIRENGRLWPGGVGAPPVGRHRISAHHEQMKFKP